ncbi:MAG: hypothetical protein ACREYC_23265 [Gammaproteobacteria bacterium]
MIAGQVSVREIRKRTDSGHQTAVFKARANCGQRSTTWSEQRGKLPY